MTALECEQSIVYRGGFPCQPHSVAGKRQASGDERDLWPEMRRVIGEINPRWVVGENVRGLLSSEDGRFFRGILRDFADLGFDVGWCVVSAASVGAVHRRERVAIIAHANSDRLQGRFVSKDKETPDGQPSGIFAPLLQRIDENQLSESAVCGSHDGVSGRMDELKGLGNAVCPPQFYPIYKAITCIERERMIYP